MAHVLIVDDDLLVSEMLSDLVRRLGHDAVSAATLSDGLTEIRGGEYDLVLLDVHLPDGNGLDALPDIRNARSAPEVIIVTGAGEVDGAELAIKFGAWDYIQKPSSMQDMMLPIVRALQYREESKARGGAVALDRAGILGDSPRMKACLDLLAQASSSDVNVLITGETGTGKELFAAAIHKNSARSGRSFVVVDCSSLPETLVESTIFGYTKGAFTGAAATRDGLIKQADGGSLFLDEVGELPLNVQKAFLRVLQERRFRPVGSGVEVQSNFRLIAATNRNLQQMVSDGLFRSDLLFRLKSFVIELPALQDRREDIKELVMHYIARHCEQRGIGLKGYSPEFLEALAVYPWPGNVRELLHALERALSAAYNEPTLFPKHLPEDIRIYLASSSLVKNGSPPTGPLPSLREGDALPFLKDHREMRDRQYLEALMSQTDGSIKDACRISGVSRSRLYELLKRHRLLL
ncbi:MAG: sigma-54-dependent transcriptional regulator [Syntrophobacteraceae bacterium]